jgi:hypothetical protein
VPSDRTGTPPLSTAVHVHVALSLPPPQLQHCWIVGGSAVPGTAAGAGRRVRMTVRKAPRWPMSFHALARRCGHAGIHILPRTPWCLNYLKGLNDTCKGGKAPSARAHAHARARTQASCLDQCCCTTAPAVFALRGALAAAAAFNSLAALGSCMTGASAGLSRRAVCVSVSAGSCLVR